VYFVNDLSFCFPSDKNSWLAQLTN